MSNAFTAVLFTEGRVVGLCWEKLKPKGPKGRNVVLPDGAALVGRSLGQRKRKTGDERQREGERAKGLHACRPCGYQQKNSLLERAGTDNGLSQSLHPLHARLRGNLAHTEAQPPRTLQ